ncbi:hypothetical protein EZV62_013835 [Acer yangbiense]|uniref:Uncharacterized protein n=1 Tax=Acer yangbiense TaxID=1000413 RepID=A0A5C7HSV2_9ROSI|nr:hypothetical protein EZV62_013835 [Acer yangbiense]
MASRNQNMSSPRRPSTKREAVDDFPFDKRRKIGAGKTALPTSTVRTRQAFEKEKLRSALESSEKKCSDTEVEMKNREVELNATVSYFRKENDSLREKYEETIGRYQESEGKSQETMRKGLTELDLMATKSKSLEERIRLLEHQLTAANDRLKASQHLRGELQLVRDDRDSQVSKLQALTATIVKYQETIGKCLPELDLLTTKSKSSQRESIRILEQQPTVIAANEK